MMKLLKHIKIILIIIVCSLPCKLFGQEGNGFFLDSQFFEQDDYNKLSTTLDYSKIKGTPFLHDDNFEIGEVYLANGKKLKELDLRYNLVHGTFEFKHDGKINLLSKTKSLGHVNFRGNRYDLVSYKDSKGEELSFMERVAESENVLLYLYKASVYQKEEKSNNPYEKDKPAQFVRQSDKIFIMIDGALSEEIKNKRHLIAAFEGNEGEVKTLVKKLKVNPNKVEDIKMLIEAL